LSSLLNARALVSLSFVCPTVDTVRVKMAQLLLTIASLFVVLALILLGRSFYNYQRQASTNKLAAPPRTTVSTEKQSVGPEPPSNNTNTGASYLPRSITDSDEDVIDRGDWVQRLTDHVYTQRHASRYNVLTIHTNIDYHFRPEGVIEQFNLTYANRKTGQIIPYETVVFRNGHLTRLGDGGYINWCFEGNFDRMDNFVVFKSIG
jgi:hypothetical protein